MKQILLLLVFLTGFLQANAQGQRQVVQGTVQSKQDNTTLPGASVVLTKTADGTTTGTATDPDGKFRFESVAPGEYTLQVNYVGFKQLNRPVRVQNTAVNLGNIQLESDATNIKEVEVVGRVPLGEQKGDTSQFNAKAFKTAPDASAEDLVTKMPGVTVQNGTVQAQGEDIRQVMIDGKRYVGEDVNTAMRNISSDMIESVQIFDGQSDQAAFSGFDDGNRVKTINFVTRRDRRQGYTGKASAALGTDTGAGATNDDMRYMVGAAINYFNNDRRITFTGLTNNINMFDFSVGETPGGGMRGRRGGWGRSSPNGIINTNNIGLNYNDKWGKKMEVAANYNFSKRIVNNDEYRFRDFFGNDDIYTENTINRNMEESHRLNFRLQYNINENNRLLITPNVSVQQNDGRTNRFGFNINAGDTLNTIINRNLADSRNVNFNNNILYSHRFGESGRIFNASFNTNYSTTDGDETQFVNSTVESRDQYILNNRNNMAWSGSANYSQFISSSKTARLQLEYTVSNQANDVDRSVYERAGETTLYNIQVPILSNTFNSNYLAQSIGPSYQYRTEKVRFQANARYQYATLQSDVVNPEAREFTRHFNNVLPSAEYEYKFSNSRNLRVEYRSGTNVPSADQLQEILNLANPSQPRLGNPLLEQDFQNRLNLRYRNFDSETNRVFFVGMFGTMTQDAVVNSTYTRNYINTLPADNVITRVINNYEQQTGKRLLDGGGRLIRPTNLNGHWNVRSFFNYGQPLNFLSSNFNISGFAGYTRAPGMIDDRINFANTVNLGSGINLSSNISEKVDFNVSTNINRNFVRNTDTGNNYEFTVLNSNARLNWIIWKGIVYRTELAHQYNSGISGNAINFALWNMSIGKKLLKNQQAEVSLSVNDLLNQNRSIQNNVTEIFAEDVRSNVLQRFFMLTFSYNIRSFAGAAPQEENNRGGRPGGYGGGRQ